MTDALEVRKKRLTEINGVDILTSTEVIPPSAEPINEGPVTRQDVANTTKVATFKALFYPEENPEYVQQVIQTVADMVANAGMPTLSAEAMVCAQLEFRDPNRVRIENVVRKEAQTNPGQENNYRQESFNYKRGVVAVGYRGSGQINPANLLPNPDFSDADLIDEGRQLISRTDSIEEMHVIVAGKPAEPEVEKPIGQPQIARPEPVTITQTTPTISNSLANPFLDPSKVTYEIVPGALDSDQKN